MIGVDEAVLTFHDGVREHLRLAIPHNAFNYIAGGLWHGNGFVKRGNDSWDIHKMSILVYLSRFHDNFS